MGQKVIRTVCRVGIIKDWDSRCMPEPKVGTC